MNYMMITKITTLINYSLCRTEDISFKFEESINSLRPLLSFSPELKT